MSYTKGPWRISENGAILGPKGHNTVRPEDSLVICRMAGTLKNRHVEADAHLVAAAPELLRAARLARRRMIAHGGSIPETRSALKALEAAIAKATGETASD